MEYTLVLDKDTNKLIAKVNQLIALVWKPLGGATFGTNYYCQTMIREKP